MFLYDPPYAKRTFTMILSRPCISYILQWQLLYFLSDVVFQSKLPRKSPRTRQITTPSSVSRHGHRSAGAAAMAQSPRQRRRAQQRGGRAALHRDAEECPGEGPDRYRLSDGHKMNTKQNMGTVSDHFRPFPTVSIFPNNKKKYQFHLRKADPGQTHANHDADSFSRDLSARTLHQILHPKSRSWWNLVEII